MHESSVQRSNQATWDDFLGAPESLTIFLEDAVLQNAENRLSITLDEVDRLFRYECRSSFFAMVRAWHNLRASNPVWNRVNLFIGHSTEPTLFIDDIDQSPFNVGEVLRLSDFSAREQGQVTAVAFTPDGQKVLIATDHWLNLRSYGSRLLQSLGAKLLPGQWIGAFFSADRSSTHIKIALLDIANSAFIQSISFGELEDSPIQGQITALIKDWQRRLGLGFDGQGRIFPPYLA